MHSVWVNLNGAQSVDKAAQPQYEVNNLSEIVGKIDLIEARLADSKK